MSLFTRMAEGAGIGGVMGTAIGALVGGSATTAAVAITAPVSIPVMFATGAVAVGTTLTAAEFGGAVGAVTGAGAGAVADVVDWKKKADREYAYAKNSNDGYHYGYAKKAYP